MTATRPTPPPPAATVHELVAKRDLWPINDVAYRLGVARTTIYRRIRDGDLKTTRVGGRNFISDRELRRYLEDIGAA